MRLTALPPAQAYRRQQRCWSSSVDNSYQLRDRSCAHGSCSSASYPNSTGYSRKFAEWRVLDRATSRPKTQLASVGRHRAPHVSAAIVVRDSSQPYGNAQTHAVETRGLSTTNGGYSIVEQDYSTYYVSRILGRAFSFIRPCGCSPTRL